MSLSFQERFKNRMGFITKEGNINLDGAAPVAKPLSHQVYESHTYYNTKDRPPLYSLETQSKVSEQSGYASPTVYAKPESFGRKQTHSAKPIRDYDNEKRSIIKTSQGLKAIEEYKPYTLNDYKIIKSEKYYELGGLGPSNVGTDDWKQKKDLMDKRLSYAKHVQTANSSIPLNARRPKETERQISKSEKAKQFARMIPKPAPKSRQTPDESKPAISSVLEELEKKHMSYNVCIEAIKSSLT